MQNPDEENALRAENERLRERLSDLERRLARISAGGSSDYELTQAMNEREMLLAEAERIAHMGSWVWDVRTNHVTWSVDLFHILGYDPSRDVPSVAAFFARVHPDDIERVRAASQRVAATGQGRYIEYRLLLPGNVVRHVSTDGASVFDGAGVHLREVGIVLDRTAIAEATLELRRAHWLLEETQRSTRTGSWEWDPATGVVRWSRGLYELLGISPEMPATVERFERMLHPEDRAETLARRARLEQSDLSAVELPYVCRVQRGDGQCRKVQIVSDALRDERGEITMMIGTITDVTERSELEAQLRQSQKMEAVGQLAGGIAHDFNNLLTIILAGAGVLRRSQPSELLEDIERAARSAAALTQRLLAFSRRAPYAPRAVDLRQVVEEIQPLITRAVGEKISTSFGTSPDACIVRVDVNQAQQALLNLAVNARDAMPEGGRLGFALERTSLSRGHGSRLPAGDYALVTVSDTGGGIDAAHLSRIFEPFFTTKDPGRGTGLGLTLVRGAMQQCGGAVTVESRPGAGCTFRLYFPLTAALPERHEPPVSMSVRRADVLLVEDDDTVRRMVADMLGGMGCRVTAVDGARAALAAWEASGARYELLVTDVVMPGRHGDELAAELVARAPQLAVLFVTGYVDRPFDPDRLPRARVLLKPFDLDALRRVVAELLEPPAAARTAT